MLSVRQAALKIGVSESLIYSWIEARQLPHYRIGAKGKRGKILIAEADLEAFIESLRVEPEGAERRAAANAPDLACLAANPWPEREPRNRRAPGGKVHHGEGIIAV